MVNTLTPAALACAAIALAAVLANFILVAMRWSDLPQKVPRHFGLSGRPDAWGGRRIIWLYPVLSLVMWLAIGGICVVEAASDEAVPASKDTEAVTVIVAYLAVIMLYITVRSFAVAEKRADGLGRMFLPVLLLGIVLIMTRYA